MSNRNIDNVNIASQETLITPAKLKAEPRFTDDVEEWGINHWKRDDA